MTRHDCRHQQAAPITTPTAPEPAYNKAPDPSHVQGSVEQVEQPAASGGAELELLEYAVMMARRRKQAGGRGHFALNLESLEEIAALIRRLSGQGDVERLVEALEEISTVAHSDQSESDLETVLAWLASVVDPLIAKQEPPHA